MGCEEAGKGIDKVRKIVFIYAVHQRIGDSQMTPDEAKKFLEKNVVPSPGINLQGDEVCYYAEEASAIVAKNQNIGTTYNSFGTGLYKRGVGVHSSQGVRNIVRGTVTDQYPGHLYLTSQRIVLVTYKAGFDIALMKLTGLDFLSDGLMVTSAGKSYLVAVKNTKKLKQIIEASNLILTSSEEIPPSSNPNTHTEKDSISLLKEYKELLDQGIITQEEFDAKKESLLQPAPNNNPSYQFTPSTGISAGTSNKTVMVILWIIFAVTTFFAIFSLKSPVKIKFFILFGMLAAGCILHIDPLHLRAKGKIPPVPLTWIICAVIGIGAAVLIK